MAQAYQLPFLIHEELRKELSQERASKIADILEKSVGMVFDSAKDIAIQKKLEIKDELSKELASKADVALVKADLAVVKSELKSEMRLYFVITICVIVVLNKDALTFIAQLLGLVK